MHIASVQTLVRRAPVQSDVLASARFQAPEQADSTRAWIRKVLPGALLLTVLVLLGGLFPVLL